MTSTPNRVVKEHNHEFVYSISEDGTRNEETECDYHTYVDNMCQEWDKVDPLGVFGKEYNNDQQKVVNKRKWRPKPKDQRQFRNWNRKHNIRSSNQRRNLFSRVMRFRNPIFGASKPIMLTQFTQSTNVRNSVPAILQ